MAGYDASRTGDFDNDWNRITAGINMGIGEINVGANEITNTWDEIAQNISSQYDINLVALPQGAFGASDQLAFLPFGHTVMFLAGLNQTDERDFGYINSFMDFSMAFADMTTVVHSSSDCFHYIEARWPGRIAENMRGFSIFLERILLAEY